MKHYINTLLDLPEEFQIEPKIKDGKHYIYLSLPQKEHICPVCHTTTDRVHDYREQRITDLPLLMKENILIMKKRRYVCPSCGKRFYEDNPLIAPYKRQTNRLQHHVLGSLSELKSLKQIGREHFISAGIVGRIMASVHYPRLQKLPKVLSIDEFRGNVGSKFQCLLVDPENHEVLDVLPTRNSEDLRAYFSQYPLQMRKQVEYVVMDLSSLFRSVLTDCFPNAKVVADKFHVVRLISWAMDNIRKEVQKHFSKGRRIYFKHSKHILLKHYEALTWEEQNQLSLMLGVSDKLYQAYVLKEMFYHMMDSKTKEEFHARYMAFKMAAEKSELTAFTKHIPTLDSWYHAIERACLTGYSNAFVEGCNNRTKVLKRVSYGLGNFTRFRTRLLCISHNTETMIERRVALANVC